jgi:hypothetical protein
MSGEVPSSFSSRSLLSVGFSDTLRFVGPGLHPSGGQPMHAPSAHLQAIPILELQNLIALGGPSVDSPRQVIPDNADAIDLDAHAVADHPVIVRILWEGWQCHIPLTALTNEKCRAASFIDYSGLGDQGKKTQLSLDAAAEGTMPQCDWIEAWPRLCAHIEKHLNSPDPGRISDAFRAHFAGVLGRRDFKRKYFLYLEYDIHIRTLWVHQWNRKRSFRVFTGFNRFLMREVLKNH